MAKMMQKQQKQQKQVLTHPLSRVLDNESEYDSENQGELTFQGIEEQASAEESSEIEESEDEFGVNDDYFNFKHYKYPGVETDDIEEPSLMQRLFPEKYQKLPENDEELDLAESILKQT